MFLLSLIREMQIKITGRHYYVYPAEKLMIPSVGETVGQLEYFAHNFTGV